MSLVNHIKILAKKKSLHEVAFIYAGALINGISLFSINIFLGRILAKELFGTFTLSVLVLSTVAEMSDFGLNGGLLRFAPFYLQTQQFDKLKQLVKTIWSWRVSLSAILTFGGIALSGLLSRYVFNRPEITEEVMFSFLGVGGVVLVGFTSAYLQASQRFFTNSIVQSLKGLLRFVLVIVLYFLGVKDIYPYLLVYILIPWLLFIFTYRALPAGFWSVSIDSEVKKKLHSQLAKFSFWLTVWSLSAILASRIDQIMISHLLGLDQVAVYAMAFQFVLIYSFALQAITSVLTPKISGLTSKQQLVDFSWRIMKYLIPLMILIALLIYPSQYVIQFIFGKKYIEALPIYLILSYSMLINFLGVPSSLIITVFNRTHLVAASGFFQLIVNVVFSLLLVPRFGVIGSAYTFGVGAAVSLVYNVVSAQFLIKYRNLSIS